MAAGQSLADMWPLTLREIALVFRGVRRRREEDARQQRSNLYEAAALNWISVNDPSQFPKAEDFLMGVRKKRGLSEAAVQSLQEADALAYQLLAKRKSENVS